MWHVSERTRDTNPSVSRFQVGDIVEVVDPFVKHFSHRGRIITTEWGRQYFKTTWAYEVDCCKRFFGPWQLRKVFHE